MIKKKANIHRKQSAFRCSVHLLDCTRRKYCGTLKASSSENEFGRVVSSLSSRSRLLSHWEKLWRLSQCMTLLTFLDFVIGNLYQFFQIKETTFFYSWHHQPVRPFHWFWDGGNSSINDNSNYRKTENIHFLLGTSCSQLSMDRILIINDEFIQ
jgi:hypothetical protein